MKTIKFLHVADFHFDARNLEICKENGWAVAGAAHNHKVDFILDAGDWFNRPHYLAKKDSVKEAGKIIENWQKTAGNVFGIYGTPSHQAPGSMDLFDGYIKMISPLDPYILSGKCIIFGIPEVSKKYMPLSGDAAKDNAEIVERLYHHFDSYIAPTRAQNPDIPAVCAIHGNLSDARKENSTDIIMRQSDIVLHTERLANAGINYFAAGHIHKPSEFKNIPGGYAGGWGATWNDVDFVPGFNLVEIHPNGSHNITRIPYGTPERRKIYSVSDIKDKDIAYLLETDDESATLPEGVHPWSEIRLKPKEKTSSRQIEEKEEYTLWDLFKAADPDAPENIKERLAEISKTIPQILTEEKSISVQSVEIAGCVLFGGRTVNFDLSKLNTGLNQIDGHNGSGKSSLLSFCTPYPVIVGKDTDSGRQSAIKDFFKDKESYIKKTVIYNGEKHEHTIAIQGAHTKSPKAQCFVNVDGVPQLDTVSFDELLAWCEQTYGDFNDYLITTFYVQPFQGSFDSSLMTASMTTIRNIVQHIAGIDYEREKTFALSKVKEAKDKIDPLQARIDLYEEDKPDIDALDNEKYHAESNLQKLKVDLANCQTDGDKAKAEVARLQKKSRETDRLIERREALKKSITNTTSQIFQHEKVIEESDAILKEAEGYKATLERQKSIQADIATIKEEQADTLEANNKIESDFNTELAEWQTEELEKERAIKSDKDTIVLHNKSIELKNDQIESMSVACPQCGYIDPEITNKIEKVKGEIKLLNDQIDFLKDEIINIESKQIPEPVKPELVPIPREAELDDLTAQLLSNAEISRMEFAVNSSAELKARIDIAKEQLPILKADLKRYDSEISDVVIDETIKDQLEDAEGILEYLRHGWQVCKTDIATLETELKHIDEKIDNARKRESEYQQAQSDLVALKADFDDWNYIARMLNPDKVPAVELDMIASGIDAYANKNITPFLNGRFSYRTDTQQEGKKKLIDKFDIVIHDSLTGEEKSFTKHSPGEKAFLSDAYVKALIQKRLERNRTIYSPVVSDEADGPVDPERVPMYYEIQQNYYAESGTCVLVVSHAPDAHNYIQNTINIEEVKS